MTAAQVGYGRVLGWIKALLRGAHATSIAVVTWAVLSLVAAQRATPAALARALPADEAGSGRASGGCAAGVGGDVHDAASEPRLRGAARLAAVR